MISNSAILEQVQYFESLEPKFPSLSVEERARLLLAMMSFYDSISPYAKIGKYAAGGAVVGAVLPRVSWLTGGLIGAAIGLYKNFSQNEARQRMAELISRLG